MNIRRYQIIEVYTDDTPMHISVMGTAHNSYDEAVKALEAFLWEEVGQQQSNIGVDLASIGIEVDKDKRIWQSWDSTFEWRILEITTTINN